MSREGAVLITVGFALVLLALMAWAWRRRMWRDAGLVAPMGAPDTVSTRMNVLYVATTRHEAPLERLALKPLAYRARGQATLGPRGLGLELDGAAPVLITRAQLQGVERSTWTIDRVVEPGGLVRVTWIADPDTPVDSYLRLTAGDPAEFIHDLAALCQATQTGASA